MRGYRPPPGAENEGHEEETHSKRRCSPNWARLISKVYQVDALQCRKCGAGLKVIAYITDVVRVPVDDEGREVEVG